MLKNFVANFRKKDEQRARAFRLMRLAVAALILLAVGGCEAAVCGDTCAYANEGAPATTAAPRPEPSTLGLHKVCVHKRMRAQQSDPRRPTPAAPPVQLSSHSPVACAPRRSTRTRTSYSGLGAQDPSPVLRELLRARCTDQTCDRRQLQGDNSVLWIL